MTDVCTFAQLSDTIRAKPGPVRLVGVDGCGGAGKTTFAAALSHAAGNCPVVHTDDFATHGDALGWWPRMLDEVIEPLSHGRPARFRRYDWVLRCPGDEVTVEPAAVVVIEGVGATRAAWRHRLAISVWVDAPRDVRFARGIARDGEQLRGFWEWWMAQEDVYVAAEQPQRHVDLIVDGDPPQRPPDDEFVALSAPRAGDAASRRR